MTSISKTSTKTKKKKTKTKQKKKTKVKKQNVDLFYSFMAIKKWTKTGDLGIKIFVYSDQ